MIAGNVKGEVRAIWTLSVFKQIFSSLWTFLGLSENVMVIMEFFSQSLTYKIAMKFTLIGNVSISNQFELLKLNCA